MLAVTVRGPSRCRPPPRKVASQRLKRTPLRTTSWASVAWMATQPPCRAALSVNADATRLTSASWALMSPPRPKEVPPVPVTVVALRLPPSTFTTAPSSASPRPNIAPVSSSMSLSVASMPRTKSASRAN